MDKQVAINLRLSGLHLQRNREALVCFDSRGLHDVNACCTIRCYCIFLER